jgi:hypothetical protein
MSELPQEPELPWRFDNRATKCIQELLDLEPVQVPVNDVDYLEVFSFSCTTSLQCDERSTSSNHLVVPSSTRSFWSRPV